jgi:hypothetical protein
VVLGCGQQEPTSSQPRATDAQQAWGRGPRDSAKAGTTACELAQTLNLLQHPCIVAAYAETSREYVVRVRGTVPEGTGVRDAARVVVRLSKQGDSATVEQIARP